MDIRQMIEQAMVSKTNVKIFYRDFNGQVTVREVSPIQWVDGSMFLAFCHLRNENRHFRLGRIVQWEIIANKPIQSAQQSFSSTINSVFHIPQPANVSAEITQNKSYPLNIYKALPDEFKARIQRKRSMLISYESQKVGLQDLKPSDVIELAPGISMEFMRVEAGEFLRGTDPTKDRHNSSEDEPFLHKQSVEEFSIGRYPVTNKQFSVFVNATRYKSQAEKNGRSNSIIDLKRVNLPGIDWRHLYGPSTNINGKEDHPVVHVSWEDATAFCSWASKISGQIVRLPSEAEWEKAARGTDGRIYPWGDVEPDQLHCNSDFREMGTTPVDTYSPLGDSLYGCADMAGNVNEWTADWFDETYYKKLTISNKNQKVQRGGSWANFDGKVRIAYFFLGEPTHTDDITGFRCVLQASSAKNKEAVNETKEVHHFSEDSKESGMAATQKSEVLIAKNIFMSQIVPNCFKMVGLHKYEPVTITFAELVRIDSYSPKLTSVAEPFAHYKISDSSHFLESLNAWLNADNHQLVVEIVEPLVIPTKEARKAEVAAKNAGSIASINAATIANVEFMSQFVPNCFKMTGFHKYEPAKITFAQLVEMDNYSKKLANMAEPFSASKVSTGSYTLEGIASWAAGENHQIVIK